MVRLRMKVADDSKHALSA